MTAARGAELLGLDAGMVVQELGWDEDTDPDLRDEIMDAIADLSGQTYVDSYHRRPDDSAAAA